MLTKQKQFKPQALVGLMALALSQNVAIAEESQQLPNLVVEGETSTKLATPTSTGSYLGLTPLETAASVEVLDRQKIEQFGDIRLIDVISRSTGMTGIGHNGNGNQDLSSRGFTGVASVLRLYDGQRQYAAGVAFPFDTWSVDQIEILRGPSSVLYGNGAIGGVVNVIPKKPSREAPQHELLVTVGSDDTRRFGLGSGGAINDRVAYRVDLSHDKTNGWIDHGDAENVTFSGALLFDVTDDLEMTLSYSKGNNEPTRYFGTPLINGEQDKSLRGNNYNVKDSKIQFDDEWFAFNMDWQLNAATSLVSKFYHLESKREWKNTEHYVYNNVTGLIDRDWQTEITHDQSSFGNTTVLNNEHQLFGLNHKVSVGFDVNKTIFEHTNNTYSGSSTSVDLNNPEAGYYNPSNSPAFIPRYKNKVEQYSIFMENNLELTEQLSVTGGLRYDHAEVKRKDLTTNLQTVDTNFYNLGWRLGSVYKLTPSFSVYAQYTRAADPVGGLAFLSNPDLKLAKGRQIEAGVKKMFWNDTAEWTLAVYDIEKKDLLTRDPLNIGNRIQVGQQSSKGVEATLSLPVTSTLHFDANATILKAEFDEFTDRVAGMAVSREGNVPTNVPERVANATLAWQMMPDWRLNTTMRYVGERYADTANELKLPSYTVTDLSLAWQATADTAVTLRANNVFDKYYFTTAYYEPNQWHYGAERSYELSVHHSF